MIPNQSDHKDTNPSHLDQYASIPSRRLTLGRNSTDYLLVGAKAYNLLVLEQAAPLIQEAGDSYGTKFRTLSFEIVTTDVYKAWLDKGREALTNLDALYTKMMKEYPGQELIVRSSAVYSEDGENMGPGIYSSVIVASNCGFQTFIDAIEAVYKSVNCPSAITYREQQGITEQELMALVIQPYLYSGVSAYSNSTRLHVPNAIDVIAQKKYTLPAEVQGIIDESVTSAIPFIFNKSVIKKDVSLFDKDLLLVEADTVSHTSVNPYDMLDLARVSLAIEDYFGHPVQIEFASLENAEVVQVRPLPESWGQAKQVEFLSSDPLLTMHSVNAVDCKLPVLGHGLHNRRKQGIVVFSGSFYASKYLNEIQQLLPAKGVVILLNDSNRGCGHIETLALERGLTLLINKSDDSNQLEHFLKHLTRAPISFEHFDSLAPSIWIPKKDINFRVIANGLEGRVYLED